MTIAKRLLLLLSISALALAALVGINFSQMNHLYESAMFSSENVTPSIKLLDKMKTDLANVRIRAYRHVLNTDSNTMIEIEKTWNEAVDKVNAGFRDYEKLVANDEDRRLLEEEKRLFAPYVEKSRKVLELSSQNRNEEALKGLNANAPLARELSQTFDKHMELNEKLEDLAVKEAAATKQRTIIISLIAAAVSLLAIAGIVLHTRKAILSQLAEANQLASRVAAGDLSQHNLTLSNDEIGAMMRSLEKMRGDLAQTVAQIMQSTHALAESSGHLATAAHQVSTSSESQSSATSAAAAAVEELTVSIDHVGSSADDANARAEEAGEAAVNSGQNVSQASNQIGRVAESVEDTSGRIRSLADQVQLIGNITTVIREVADQTNLLALNAAIEAARAGEQGRGFAVVADEVRKLAERTTLSVQEISTLISSIQAGVSGAEQSMEASRQIVTEVVTVAETASSSMGNIETATSTAREAIAGISYALREQRSTSTELAQNVESIAQMSEENSAAAAAVSDTARQLVQVADTLKSAVSRFRV